MRTNLKRTTRILNDVTRYLLIVYAYQKPETLAHAVMAESLNFRIRGGLLGVGLDIGVCFFLFF
jgi:hypothetical protein